MAKDKENVKNVKGEKEVGIKRQIPNILSLSRVPFLLMVTLIIITNYHNKWRVALVLYTIAGVTDFFDGWVARRYNYVTVAGIFLDALCDKVLNIGMLVTFLVLGLLPKYCLMPVILCMSREFLITGMRLVLASRKVVPADKGGKMKTATQMVSIGFLLLSKALDGHDLDSVVRIMWYIGIILFFVSVILTTWSGMRYVVINKDLLLE